MCTAVAQQCDVTRDVAPSVVSLCSQIANACVQQRWAGSVCLREYYTRRIPSYFCLVPNSRKGTIINSKYDGFSRSADTAAGFVQQWSYVLSSARTFINNINAKYHTSCETFIGGTKLEKRLCEYNWYSHAYTAVLVQQWLCVRYVKCSYRGILPMYGIAVSRN